MINSTNSLSSSNSNVSEIISNLLATLDENIFFTELGKYFLGLFDSDRVSIYKVLDDGAAILIAQNDHVVLDGEIIAKGKGVIGHVIRTKKGYFTNNILRDPLYTQEQVGGVQKELLVPIVVDQAVMAILKFSIIEGQRDFSRDDLAMVLSTLNELKRPLLNMKIYLAAKNLNEALLKKLEEKDREISLQGHAINKDSVSANILEKDLIGNSKEMKHLIELAEKMSSSDVNFSIEGELGTGREVLARRIHCRSKRKNSPFIYVDFSSIVDNCFETELFGSESAKGGYDKALKKGLLELANNGTIVLNRIGLLPAMLQAKLVQFLKDGIGHRISGANYRSNVRFITIIDDKTTKELTSGTIRQDLFYLLNTITIKTPALRERREDIELLAGYFLNNGKKVDEQKMLTPSAIKALCDYRWPGNIRELANVMERAAVLADGKIIDVTELPENILTFKAEDQSQEEEAEEISFKEMTLNELEKRHICQTLEHLSGNKTRAAKALGITVKTLYNKLHSYGMVEEDKDALVLQ